MINKIVLARQNMLFQWKRSQKSEKFKIKPSIHAIKTFRKQSEEPPPSPAVP
jgi:hypothetical protein